MKEKFKIQLPYFFTMVLVLILGVTACDEDDDNANPDIAAPSLKNASDIQATSFKIDWTAVTGTDEYLLEVSSKSDFSTTLSGYNKKEIDVTSATVSGLTSKNKYYVRVYAKKGSSVSKPSSVKEVTTI